MTLCVYYENIKQNKLTPLPGPGIWALYFFTQNSTVHCSLFTVNCSLYTVHCSLFTVHCSLFTVHCSLFTVHCAQCAVIVRYSVVGLALKLSSANNWVTLQRRPNQERRWHIIQNRHFNCLVCGEQHHHIRRYMRPACHQLSAVSFSLISAETKGSYHVTLSNTSTKKLVKKQLRALHTFYPSP